MTINTYKFEIEGTGANDQTWITMGTVACEFHDVFDSAMEETFQQLTDGKAVYGKPGVGCRGPYKIDRVAIVKVKP